MTDSTSLALSEIYLSLAYIFRRFEFESFDTIASRDVETSNDCFVGMTNLKSEGIKIMVTQDRLQCLSEE